MRGHVDAETLGAFGEDLLPRRKAARVSAHLAACPRCAGLDAELAEVTALLARPAAPPMPAALTARIEAALAAEAAARSAASADAAPGTAAPDSPVMAGPAMAGGPGPRARKGRARDRSRADRAARPPARNRSGLALRIAAATAAVAILGGGGYGEAKLLSVSPTLNTTSGAPLHRAPGVAPRMSGQAGGPAEQPAISPGAPAPSTATGGYPVFNSGTNYLPGRLAAQVRALLPAAHESVSMRNGKTGHPTAAPPSFPGLYACVARMAGGKRPEFVDVASYRGRPAAVIAVAGARPGTLRVLIVGTGCAASGLLATTTLPVAP